jgi:hypothetical protein
MPEEKGRSRHIVSLRKWYGVRVMPPRFDVDKLSHDELEEIRRFIEEGDELSDEMHALVEKYWPWLLEEAPPRAMH